MKICNCTLPTIHGADVCKNCANYNEYQPSDQFNENIAMIDRYFENITKTELLEDLKNAGMKSSERGVEVRWIQPTNEAKDDGEMYCGNCDEYIDNECWRYCPKCGVRLLIHGRDIF